MKGYTMELIPETDDPAKYLEGSDLLDYDGEAVIELGIKLKLDGRSDTEIVRTVFEYMQANIPHTLNAGLEGVACSASDVIALGHGICYAKANLAAALLRSAGVPTGFCYQKYRREETTDSPFVVHCLNAVFLDGRWARVDVRNPVEGFDPAFKPGEDSGDIPVDPALGEEEYTAVYVRPHPATIAALKNSRNAAELDKKLPQGL
jgi:transglutaminase-like putative cysteine protease